MKTRWSMAIGFAVLFFLTCNVVRAQEPGPDGSGGVNRVQNGATRNRHTAFNDQDSKATHDWYNQFPDQAPVGVRYQGRFSADGVSRVQAGFPLDAGLQKKVYPAPMGFWQRLTAAPRNYHFVAFEGHVVAIDDKYQYLNDVIHLEFNF